MPSYAELLGLAEDDLRQRTVSLAAYALSLSDRTFDFPISDVPPDQRTIHPVSAPEDELRVEAAMTMLGAAGASMVIDQQIGLGLTSVAADWYWRAGHYFGAFLQAILGVRGEGALAVASELAERPILGAADRPAKFFPEQLAYLAMGEAIGGNIGLADRLFNYVPEATAIGAFRCTGRAPPGPGVLRSPPYQARAETLAAPIAPLQSDRSVRSVLLR